MAVASSFLQYPLYIGVLFAICWCVLVSASRLYMGMHTLQVHYFSEFIVLKFNIGNSQYRPKVCQS